MAVAVKNPPDASGAVFSRLEIASLAGALYVLCGLGAVAFGVPRLWSQLVSPAIAGAGQFVDAALLLVAMFAAAVALVWLGTRLVGTQPTHGLKAGVFTAVVAIVLTACLVSGIGYWAESWSDGSANLALGMGFTGAVAAILIGLILRMMFRPDFAPAMEALEDQGWFSTTSYKRYQGMRVRRGTIIGILTLAGCGIFTMLSHKTLENSANRDWVLPIPFTAGHVTDPGDTNFRAGDAITRPELRAANESLKDQVKIKDAGDTSLEVGSVTTRDAIDAALKKAGDTKRAPSTSVPTAATGSFPSMKLLPDVRFTVPMLFTVAAMWLAWRVVNYPTFADFLIATEAEMNKVSWTTRRRLVQDTIVVLTTVLLMTIFLMAADLLWGWALKSVGVLRIGDSQRPDAPQSGNTLDW
jgi:preprotein translocase SecE subunit